MYVCISPPAPSKNERRKRYSLFDSYRLNNNNNNNNDYYYCTLFACFITFVVNRKRIMSSLLPHLHQWSVSNTLLWLNFANTAILYTPKTSTIYSHRATVLSWRERNSHRNRLHPTLKMSTFPERWFYNLIFLPENFHKNRSRIIITRIINYIQVVSFSGQVLSPLEHTRRSRSKKEKSTASTGEEDSCVAKSYSDQSVFLENSIDDGIAAINQVRERILYEKNHQFFPFTINESINPRKLFNSETLSFIKTFRSAATRRRDRGAGTRHGIHCAVAREGGGRTRATTEGRRHLFLATRRGKRTGGRRRERWKSCCCWRRTRWARWNASIQARAACTRFTNGRRGIIRGTRCWPRSTKSNWRRQIRRTVGDSWSGRICGSARCSPIDRRIISAPAGARWRR